MGSASLLLQRVRFDSFQIERKHQALDMGAKIWQIIPEYAQIAYDATLCYDSYRAIFVLAK
jgi:hypothetical protein